MIFVLFYLALSNRDAQSSKKGLARMGFNLASRGTILIALRQHSSKHAWPYEH
jgi:hypothetical protein